ncbi:MAG TPA: D-aminoacyl-tRNA deacylase [Thermoplasmata archaeon]|nr:D-aminoacyl-tRNA deacylase [Thermoplasmata archaeon]
MSDQYLVVVSEPDPVAAAVVSRWGTPPATEDHVEGAPIRRLGRSALLLRRPRLHIQDERLDALLPASLQALRPTLVFPSIHRSEQNVPCLTVHPLGNPGPDADVGGRPGAWDPSDPARMAATLRALAERAGGIGWAATYEATHHGPYLELPAFFVEIGYGTADAPPPAAVDLLAEVIPRIEPTESDRVAVAIGGGHYAPHFTDLTLRRRWAFGHIVSRHALATLTPASARAALDATPGAQGIVFARAEDAHHPSLAGLGPRLRDQEAPRRERPTGDARPASGT